MGWILCEVSWTIMINLWNRMLDLPDERMASRIFMWDIIGGSLDPIKMCMNVKNVLCVIYL